MNTVVVLGLSCILGVMIVSYTILDSESVQKRLLMVIGVFLASPILFFSLLIYRILLIPLYPQSQSVDETDTDI